MQTQNLPPVLKRSSGPPRFRVLLQALALLATLTATTQAQLGSAVKQLLVTQSKSWNSSTGYLQAFQRSSSTQPWSPVFSSQIPVMLGRNGLAWGRGVFQPPKNGVPLKVERDGKAPAGIFQLGRLFGYADTPPSGVRWPFQNVGPWDAYVDDPKNPYYNQHVRVDPRQVPAWFESQRMRLGDFAYKWKLEIRHNQQPVAPGYGSAIFFHIRRGPDKPSAGCTTMRESDLIRLLKWLDIKASPHYVLLPQADYQALRGAWHLP